MPRGLILALAIVAVLALIPFALIARARAVPSAEPRIHLIQDMGSQPKFKPQAANPMFADGRAMRPAIAGTVARGDLRADQAVFDGRLGDDWATTFPMPVTEAMMRRGQERYQVFCQPCHGAAGTGDGLVAKRADELQEGTWTPPASFHTATVQERPVGHLYNTIAHGIRNMPAYGAQIDVADRWAVVAYVRALQRSQNARMADVPPELRGKLK